MNKKAQWILSEQEIKVLEHQRNEHYRQLQYPLVDHTVFNRGYLWQFVRFVRERKKKQTSDMPFKFQKVVYYTIVLYKRYYLVNSYVCEDLCYTQAIICSFYLSLKFNEYDHDYMNKTAFKWKPKPFFNYAKNQLPHYGDDNYTQAELRFLSGIKFQTALSKVITPIEAIYHILVKGRNALQEVTSSHYEYDEAAEELKDAIFDCLNLLYGHPTLMFLFEGPKIALAIMIYIMRNKKMPLERLGEEFEPVLRNNMQEIEQIIVMMEEEREEGKNEKYQSEKAKIANLQGFKKPLHKSQQTPRLQPRHQSFIEQE